MANAGQPTPIPFPTSSFPGANPQESAGRLINCYAEPLGDQGKGAAAPTVWRRSPGLSQFATTTNSGYRSGLLVTGAGVSYETWGGQATTVSQTGTVTALGAFPGTRRVSIAHDQVFPNPDVVAVDLDNGAYVLNTAILTSATATATLAGTSNVSDTVAITFSNSTGTVTGLPVTVTSAALAAAGTAIAAATALVTAINANTTLQAANISATNVGGTSATITFSHSGAIGNSTTIGSFTSTGGRITATLTPASGALSGGAGLASVPFTGAPLAYNAGGTLPQPNSVSFQDGYFFYTIGDGRVFASQLNSLVVNALSFITIQSHADAQLLRGIEFSGLMWFFTTSSCEVWQDVGNPPPGFPYNRLTILETGLLTPTAIAGQENGFAQLLWVSQDYGVYYQPPNANPAPQKVSPPDLDRLIEQAFLANDTLQAGCYIFAGHKFWHLSSSSWTWEFNLSTNRWNERQSLLPSGIYGRWRAMDGHLGFNKWLVGDSQTGNLLFVDDTNYTEVGMPQLFRIESGAVVGFPAYQRIARADFLFDMGVGIAISTTPGAVNPKCAVSCSLDGGLNFGNPLIRALGQQGHAKRPRVSVKNMGLTGPMGNRWRLDVTDPVYTGFLMGTQSSDPRAVGA